MKNTERQAAIAAAHEWATMEVAAYMNRASPDYIEPEEVRTLRRVIAVEPEPWTDT